MSKKTSDPAVDLSPDMGDSEALFPPSPSAVPVAANVSMKLPTFRPGLCWFHKKHGDKAINCKKPCSFSGNEYEAVTSASAEFCNSALLFVTDILSNREFLVDSGASVSVFPSPRSSSTDGTRLLTADGSSMFCSGSRLIPLRFSCGSDSRVYTWNFQLAPVSVPLLGADFLQHFNLLIHIKGCKLVHGDCPRTP